jgi:hypothetical protein
MKTVLINTACGPIVVEKALIDALQSPLACTLEHHQNLGIQYENLF